MRAIQEAKLAMGCEPFVGAAGWEPGPGLSVGQKVAMGLWGGGY